MSITYIPTAIRQLVEQRAESRCEYCLLPVGVSFFPHEIDHIIAEKHGGQTEPNNLAYTCWRCNRHKGTDLGSLDSQTGQFSFLFNPRKQVWSENFDSQDGMLIGLTVEGRVTIELLKLNTPERLDERRRID